MKINNKIQISLISLVLCATLAGIFSYAVSEAQTINEINVSAYLANNQNKIIPNGDYEIRFALYLADREIVDAYPSETDTAVWQEVQTVSLSDGFLNAYLGRVTSLPANLNFSQNIYYLGIRIGQDSEMVPRKRVGAVPLALNALNASSVQGAIPGTASGNILLLGANGKVNIAQLPTGTSGKKLVLADDARLVSKKLSVAGTPNYLTVSDHKITLSQIDLATDVSGILPIANGGTGLDSFTPGDLTYYDSGSTLSQLNIGTAGQVLTVSAGGLPTWVDSSATIYTASGTLLNLTGNNFSLNEGILTDGKLCTYEIGTGLVCNTNISSEIVSYTAGSGLTLTSADFSLGGELTKDANFTGAFDLQLGNAGSELKIMGSGGTYYAILDAANITAADKTIILPNANGTLITTGNLTDITAVGTVGSGTWNGTDIDISDYTNLSATSGIVLTGDQLSHSTANGYVHIPADGASTQLLQYSSAGTAKWISLSSDATIADGGAVTLAAGITRDTEWDTWVEHPAMTDGYILVGNVSNQAVAVAMSGDVTISNTGVTTVSDDSHAHTTTTISGLDISADTNLGVSGTMVQLSGDTISLREGTLTDGRLCTYSTANGLVCDTTSVSVGHTAVTLAGTPDYITIDGNQVITRGTIDIGDDTNLAATSGIILTGDQLTHSTAPGYLHIPTGGTEPQLLQYSADGSAKWITLSSDATLADGGALTVADDSHAHTTTTISGLDISADTNLGVSGTMVQLSGDTISLREGTLTDGRLCTYSTANGLVCDTTSVSVGHTAVTLAGTPDYITIDGNQVITRGTIDIGDDTNLAATSGIILTGDQLTHSTAPGYLHIPTGGTEPQLLQYSADGSAKWITLSSDATLADGGALTVADDSHAHTTTTISGLDISADTNLGVSGTMVQLSGDTISLREGTLTDGRLCTYSTANGLVCDTTSVSVGHTAVTLAGTPDYITIDGNQVITRGTIDIGDDTNLAATSGIILTGDQLTHSTAPGYLHIPTGGTEPQLLQYSADGSAKWITLSSDATLADGGALTVADDSHAHTTTTISGLDISADTNLGVSGTMVQLSGDTISLREGTLTDGRLCTYSTANGLVCDTTSVSVGHTAVTLAGTPDYITIDGNQVITRGTIDIGDDTNLAATSGIILTGDQLTHSTAPGYLHIPTGGTEPQLLQYSADGSAKWITLSSDATLADGGALTVADDSHAHTTTTISGLDISADTNLGVSGTMVQLSGDTISLREGTLTDGRLCTYSTANGLVCDTTSVSVGHTAVTLAGTPDYITIDGNQVITRGTIDIGDDTNLAATSGIILTGDQLTHSTAPGYIHLPSGGTEPQLLQYSADGSAKWITLSSDATLADGGALTVADDSHAHTTTTISGLDISADTNLGVSGTMVQLSGDTISLREGTLTDGRLCTYSTASGLVCDTTTSSVGTNYWTLNGNSLYPNSIAYNIGIGTTNPIGMLHIGSTSPFVVLSSGNVGIGTTNPTYLLHVTGNIGIGGTAVFSGLNNDGSEATGVLINASNQLVTREFGTNAFTSTSYLPSANVSGTTNLVAKFTSTTSVGDSRFFDNGTNIGIGNTNPLTYLNIGDAIYMTALGGNVGIGTTNPSQMLHVAGAGYFTGGTYIGANSTDNLIDDASNGSGSSTLYIGNRAIATVGSGGSISGTQNLLAKFTSTTSVGDSRFFDNGTNIGIGNTNPLTYLNIGNTIYMTALGGNVGIGTTNPSFALDISGPVGVGLRVANPSGSGIEITGGATWDMNVTSIGQLYFVVNDGYYERTFIIDDNSRKVGIGLPVSIDPAAPLHVLELDAVANSITNILTLEHDRLYANPGQNGMGAGLTFTNQNSTGSSIDIAQIAGIITDVTNTSEEGAIVFKTADMGDDNMAERVRINKDGNVGIGTTAPSQGLELGAGKWLSFEGATEDTYETIIQVTDPTGTDQTITLPNATGTAALGTGTTNYAAYWTGTNTLSSEQYTAVTRGGSGAGTFTAYGLITGGTSPTSPMQSISAGSAGQMLRSGGASALPAWSTATYPNVATSAGTILRADGNNWVASGSTFADTYTINSLLYASGANAITGLTSLGSAFLTTTAGSAPQFTAISADTFAQYALLAGRSGGQNLIGGTGVTDMLKFQGTVGNGTTNVQAIQFNVGNNGNNIAMSILNNGNVGIGTTAPTYQLQVTGNIGIGGTATFTGLNNDGSELTGILINTSNQLVTREFGSNAFTSTSYLPSANVSGTQNLLAKFTSTTAVGDSRFFDNGTNIGIGNTNPLTYLNIGNAIYMTALGGNVGIGTTAPSQALELGASKWLSFEGATEDTYETIIQVTDPTGTDQTITLPNATGTAALGTGTTNYAAYWTGTNTLSSEQYTAVTRGGSGAGTFTAYGLITGGTSPTSPMQSISAGSAGQMLRSGGASALPAWSTATYPNVATSAGTILRADGNNWVASGSTFADTYTINSLLYASGANAITGLTSLGSAFLTTTAGSAPQFTAISADTFAQYALLAGRSGGQNLIGGTGVTDMLKFQGTVGNGTTNVQAIQFNVGNNGNNIAMSILNNGNVGIGTTAPGQKLEVNGAGYFTAGTYIGANSTNNLIDDASTGAGSTTLYIGNRAIATVGSGGNVSGTQNLLAKFTSTTAVGDSRFFDNGTNIGIGNTNPLTYLNIGNAIYMTALGGNVGIGTTAPSQALELGASKWLSFEGATEDTYETIIQVTDPTGTDQTITLPNATGTAALGTGTTNYAAYWTGTNTLSSEQYTAVTRGGSGAGTFTAYGLITGGTSPTSPMQSISAGSAGQMLRSGGASALPAWSTATYPNVATSAGTILRADGNNWVASGSTFADTYTINSLLYASGANAITGLTSLGSAFLTTTAGSAPQFTAISADTFAQYALLAGRSGGQNLIGGTGVTDMLKFQGTVGNGTTNVQAIQFNVGNNGNNIAMSILNNGNVGIGVTGPSAYLQLGVGTTAPGTAPLKFTSGTNLTAAEAGAMEWDGTNLFISQTSGPTRKTIAYTSDIPAAGANTALSNLANVAINTSLLPASDDAIDLGDNTHRWRDIFLGGESIHLGTSLTDEAVISYTTSSNLLNFSTDSTSNGDIAFFSDDLYLDKSTGNVGIGITNPGARLDVSGNAFVTGIPTGTGVSQGSLYINPASYTSETDIVEWTDKNAWDGPSGTKSAFADLDNDGDFDLLIGSSGTTVYAYENTGTVSSPIWTAKSAWNASTFANITSPALADLDNDGDFDLLIGVDNGNSNAYENTGTVSSPVWTYKSEWNVGDIGDYAAPAFADLDNDGDFDLLIGAWNAVLVAYENTGTVSSPAWAAKSAWNAPQVSYAASPTFADLDNDDDFDLLVGTVNNGTIYAYENTGTASSPTWTTKSAWNGPNVGSAAKPTLVDLDNDGDSDLLIGDGGASHAYENTGSGGGSNSTLFGVAVGGVEKFKIQANGNITSVGGLTLAGNIDMDYAGLVDALSITQNGLGNIANFKDGANSALIIKNGGNVGIGTTVPTALLHLGIGTTAVAPLKFTAGTNLAAAEAGAMEWDGTNLFISQTSGPTRKTIAYTSDIPAAGANTALSNLANVAINTSLLPASDDAIDLGDNTHRWRDIFLGGESIHLGTSLTDEAVISYTTSSNLLNFSTDSTANGDIAFFGDDLYLDKSSGYVGIGITNPGATLAVAGNILTTGIPTGTGVGQGSLYINPASYTSETDIVEWTDKDAWDGPNVGASPDPALADLDNDGDQDLLIGETYGVSYGYENTGTVSSPTWTAKSAWDAPDIGDGASPAFADLDNDGDYDLLIGASDGVSHAYENTGTVSSPVWTDKNAWDAPDVGFSATPDFADLDNDGDFDLLIGAYDGVTHAYENTGTVSSPVWTDKNAWDVPYIELNTSPALADLDNDGDFDLLIGGGASSVSKGYENTGTVSNPTWSVKSAWDTPAIGNYNKPVLADLDNDSDFDLLVGRNYDTYAYENTGSGGGSNSTLFGVAVGGVEKFKIQANGNMTSVGNLTLAGNIDMDYAGLVDALSITQNGLGNIANFKDGANSALIIKDGGNVGIGTTAPLNLFSVEQTNTSGLAGRKIMASHTLTVIPSSDQPFGAYSGDPAGGISIAMSAYSYIPEDSTYKVNNLTGAIGDAENYGFGEVNYLTGIKGWAYNATSTTVGTIAGISAFSESDAGTVGRLLGVQNWSGVYGGTVTNHYGEVIWMENDGGTITNRYGLYIEATTGTATNDYGIYQATAGQKNYFAGNVGIGTTNPSQMLHVAGAGYFTGGTYIGANSTDNLIDDASNGSGSSTLYIGNRAIATVGSGGSISGTQNLLAKFTSTTSVGDSRFYDNGTNIGIGNTNPLTYLNIGNAIYMTALGGNVGIGTTNPYGLLSVGSGSPFQVSSAGIIGLGGTSPLFSLGVDSTDSNKFKIYSGSSIAGTSEFTIDSDGVTSIANLQMGELNFADDSGIISWVDMAVTGTPADNTVESYTAQLDGNPMITVYGLATGAGAVDNLGVGIGTTSPIAMLTVAGSIFPSVNDTYDLGSDSYRFRDIYLGGETIHLGTTTTDEATISYTTSTNLLNFSTDSTTNGDIAFFSDDLYLDKSSGYVGIGTTAPTHTLDIYGDVGISSELGEELAPAINETNWDTDQAGGSGGWVHPVVGGILDHGSDAAEDDDVRIWPYDSSAEIGSVYKVTFTAVNSPTTGTFVSGAWNQTISIGHGDNAYEGFQFTAPGTYTFYSKAITADGILIWGEYTSRFGISAISVKKVIGGNFYVNNDQFVVLSTGNVGVGTADPSSLFNVYKNDTSVNGWRVLNNSEVEFSPVADETWGRMLAIDGYTYIPESNTKIINEIVGVGAEAENYGLGEVGIITGSYGWAYNATTTTVEGIRGAAGWAESDAGDVSWVEGLESWVGVYGGTVEDLYGAYIGTEIDGGTATNRYSLYLDAYGTATNDFGLYQVGAAQKNYFAGNVGIGTVNPANKLTVMADSNTSTTAQLEIGPIGGGSSSESLVSKLRFKSTFDDFPSDQGPRTSAQIVSGFSGGTWGNEYLAFGVGGATDSNNDPSEKMRITAGGNVGIGTTNPTSDLQIGNQLTFQDEWPSIGFNYNFANNTYLTSNYTSNIQQDNTNGGLVFRTFASGIAGAAVGSSQIMVMTSTGNIGIGTTAPNRNLEVYGGDSAAGYLRVTGGEGYDSILELYADQGDDNADKFDLISTTGNLFQIRNNTSPLFTLTSGGNLGIGTTNPTAKLDVAGSVAFGTGDEVMRISDSGNVGIGTTAPTNTLDIYGDVGINTVGLGAELAPAINETNWDTYGAAWVHPIVGGVLDKSGDGDEGLQIPITFDIGDVLEITFTVVNSPTTGTFVAGEWIRVVIGNDVWEGYYPTAVGTYSYTYKTTSTSKYIQGSNDSRFGISAFSVKKISGGNLFVNTNKFVVLSTGNVGVGTANPSSLFNVYKNDTSVGDWRAVNSTVVEFSPAADEDWGYLVASEGYIYVPESNTKIVDNILGVSGSAENYGLGEVGMIQGLSGWAYNATTTTVDGIKGLYGEAGSVAGTVGYIEAIEGWAGVYGGTVTTLYGAYIGTEIDGGTATNRYSLYLDAYGTATNDFGLYQVGAAQKNYFAGNVGIGTTAPAHTLDIYGDVGINTVGLGAELITNGGFDSDTAGWNTWQSTIASVAGGQSGNALELTRTTGDWQQAAQDLTLEVGKRYRVSGYVKDGSLASVNYSVRVGLNEDPWSWDGEIEGITADSWVPFSFDVVAGFSNSRIVLVKTGTDDGTILFDSISVKEVIGGNFYVNNDQFVVLSTGNVGVGTADPSSLFNVYKNDTSVNGSKKLNNNLVDFSPASDETISWGNLMGAVMGYVNVPVSNTKIISRITGLVGNAENYGTGEVGYILGSDNWAYNAADAIVGDIIGVGAYSESDAGTVTRLIGVDNWSGVYGGTVTNHCGEGIWMDNDGGTITNRYGLYIEATGTATNDYGIYQATAGQKNYFAGNVGIGTTSSLAMLDISLSDANTTFDSMANEVLRLTNTDTTNNNWINIKFTTKDMAGSNISTAMISSQVTDHTVGSVDGDLVFGTKLNGTNYERMRILNTGNVGIGTTNPTYQLQTTGSLGIGGTAYFASSVGIGTTNPGYNLDVYKNSTTGSTYVANFFNDGNSAPYNGLRIQAGADDASGTTYYLDAYDGDGTQVGYIANTAGAFALTDPSDIRTKTNVVNTSLQGMDIINQLRVVDYNRLQNPDGQILHGFIAQEAQLVFPDMVNTGASGMLGIMKDQLIPVIIKGMQEQEASIAGITNDQVSIFNELSNSNDQISQLGLSLDGNAQTIEELEADVNEELNIIGGKLDDLNAEDIALNSKITDINNQLLSLSTLQSQVDEIKAQNETILSFLSVTEGKIDLMGGTLEAEGVVAGAFTVKVKQGGDSKTIGKYIICPPLIEVNAEGKCTIAQVDVDEDGIEDTTLHPLRDGKSEVVKTKVIKDNSKVFITPKSAVTQPLAVTNIIPGESFTVEMATPVEAVAGIEFDWFVVGEQVISETP